VVLPTNWPVAAQANAELLAPARAYENRIYLLVANRVGRERTAVFCGRSQIVDPSGTRLAETDTTSEALLVADIDVELARDKSIVPAVGEYEMHLFGHRRPELYGALTRDAEVVT
jgi:predicted amidohydrolase